MRYFEQALELMSDKDLLHNASVEVKADGYNARFFAASCALVCADKDERFPRERIVAALNRVDECIKVVPNMPMKPKQHKPRSTSIPGGSSVVEKLFEVAVPL